MFDNLLFQSASKLLEDDIVSGKLPGAVISALGGKHVPLGWVLQLLMLQGVCYSSHEQTKQPG